MLVYRFNQTLFTRVIAANSIAEATFAAMSNVTYPDAGGSIDQWHTPDIWTRRAVDMAKAPGVIDTIPRFVLDAPFGPSYVDVDNMHTVNAENLCKLSTDSDTHKAWIDACLSQYVGGDSIRERVAMVAAEYDTSRHNLLMRAIAGAWGLGPIPQWHAVIFPALIALDVDTNTINYNLATNVFEMDRAELARHLDERLPAQQQFDDFVELVTAGSLRSLREAATCVLTYLGWLQ